MRVRAFPELLEIGDRFFAASCNYYGAITIDQYRLRISRPTVIGDDVFVGNHNMVMEGLAKDSFVGINTFVRHMPKQSGGLFGNPPMQFERCRVTNKYEPGMLARARYFFFSNIFDVVFWRSISVLPFSFGVLMEQYLRPYCPFDGLHIRICLPIICCFSSSLVFTILAQILCKETQKTLPMEAYMCSFEMSKWQFTYHIITKFDDVVRFQGTPLIGPYLRLTTGARIGARFFSFLSAMTIDEGRLVTIHDDVTTGPDASFRCHSFEDRLLKWMPVEVGSGSTLMPGSCLVMSSMMGQCGLSYGSTTWKGQVLTERSTYDGSPAKKVVDAGRIA